VPADSTCGRFPSSWECRDLANCALFDKRPDCSAGITGQQAERLLLEQSSKGDLTSAAFLALAYEAGLGIPQNLSKALELYDQAIAGGNKTPGVLVGRERTLFLLNGGKYEDWSGR